MSQKVSPACPELVVLGAGLPRTGTLSLCTAFEILGLRCHHMMEVFKSEPKEIREWTGLMRDLLEDREVSREQLGKVLKGYKAAVDLPSCEFFAELVRENPGLKVVLTSRSGQSWFDSFTSTIGNIITSRFQWPTIVYWLPGYFEQWRMVRILHRVWLKKYGTIKPEMMDLRIQEVRETVPPGQLLEFQVQEGWKPLCAFLGLPEPDVPFPRVNDADKMNKFIKNFVTQGLLRWTLVLGTAATAVGLTRRLWL